jgi:hypothetical protein
MKKCSYILLCYMTRFSQITNEMRVLLSEWPCHGGRHLVLIAKEVFERSLKAFDCITERNNLRSHRSAMMLCLILSHGCSEAGHTSSGG